MLGFNGKHSIRIQSLYLVKNFQRILLYSTEAPSFSNYLVNSLGFSHQQAALTCRKLPINKVNDFKFYDNAVSVVDFLKNHGLEDTHVRKAVSLHPRILCSKVDETLGPKFELLQKEGFSGSDLVRVISASPDLFGRCMNDLISNLKDVMGSVENVRKLLRKSNRFTSSGSVENMISNVGLLKNDYGIDINVIRNAILLNHYSFRRNPDFYRNAVVRVEEELGIPSDSKVFFQGINLLCSCSKEKIESKCQVYKSFGWTEDQVSNMMTRYPNAFTLSEANITKKLTFLMTELGYNPDFLASHLAFLFCSFEKRLLPRYRVLRVLKEKGLLDYNLYSAILKSETNFLKMLVEPYKEDVPGLLEIYQNSKLCPPDVEPLSTVTPN